MSLSESTRTEIRNCLSILKVIAGVVLLAAISWEIIAGDHMHFSRNYLIIQLVVCILFLCDFFVRWAASERKGRFFARNFLVLLISIPYLNIIDWSGAELPRYWAMLIGIMPLMRAFLAFYIVVQWLVDNKVRKLFFAYIFTVVVFTYISALVFYDYEILVNSKLHGFGNALWWAWMNVTTVGAEIFPVTTIGKIFCVMLPSLGMMFFPIFTTYVLWACLLFSVPASTCWHSALPRLSELFSVTFRPAERLSSIRSRPFATNSCSPDKEKAARGRLNHMWSC